MDYVLPASRDKMRHRYVLQVDVPAGTEWKSCHLMRRSDRGWLGLMTTRRGTLHTVEWTFGKNTAYTSATRSVQNWLRKQGPEFKTQISIASPLLWDSLSIMPLDTMAGVTASEELRDRFKFAGRPDASRIARSIVAQQYREMRRQLRRDLVSDTSRFLFANRRHAVVSGTHKYRHHLGLYDPMPLEAWLTSSSDPAIRERRMRAAETYFVFLPPLMVDFINKKAPYQFWGPISETYYSFPEHKASELLVAIDAGEPLMPLLQKAYAYGTTTMPKGVIKTFMRVARDPVHTSQQYRQKKKETSRRKTHSNDLGTVPIGTHFSLMAPLHPAMLPASFEEMERCVGIFRHVSGFRDLGRDIKIYKGDFRRYMADLERLSENNGIQGIKDYAAYIHGGLITAITLDMAHKALPRPLFDSLTGNLMVGGDALYGDTLYRVFGDMEIGAMDQASRRMHQQIQTFGARWRSNGIDIQLQWHPLHEPVQAPNKLWLVPLTDSAQLVEEHEIMNHCVDSYASSCATGRTHIISIRSDREGKKRLSTLQLDEKWQMNMPRAQTTLTEIQNGGAWNKHPGQEAADAAAWISKQIASGEIRPDWEKIDAVRQANKISLKQHEIERFVGYDPLEPGKIEAAFKILQPYLPGRQKHWSFDSWVERLKIRESAQERINALLGMRGLQPVPKIN